MNTTIILSYLAALHQCAISARATDRSGRDLSLQNAIDQTISMARQAVAGGGKLMFIGNGGSAGIASHLAIDFTKNGRLPALAFNDGAALTCLGNDLGFDQVFARQIEAHGRKGDLLIAISSSGRSADVLNGVAMAHASNCGVVTLSGFLPNNPLRELGDVNFYVHSSEYGFVEISHLALCHGILDLAMGWKTSPVMEQ